MEHHLNSGSMEELDAQSKSNTTMMMLVRQHPAACCFCRQSGSLMAENSQETLPCSHTPDLGNEAKTEIVERRPISPWHTGQELLNAKPLLSNG